MMHAMGSIASDMSGIKIQQHQEMFICVSPLSRYAFAISVIERFLALPPCPLACQPILSRFQWLAAHGQGQSVYSRPAAAVHIYRIRVLLSSGSILEPPSRSVAELLLLIRFPLGAVTASSWFSEQAFAYLPEDVAALFSPSRSRAR
jgi:hypothetical protein